VVAFVFAFLVVIPEEPALSEVERGSAFAVVFAFAIRHHHPK
jgi:hypothetical protein